jgi:hypothetical protein
MLRKFQPQRTHRELKQDTARRDHRCLEKDSQYFGVVGIELAGMAKKFQFGLSLDEISLPKSKVESGVDNYEAI